MSKRISKTEISSLIERLTSQDIYAIIAGQQAKTTPSAQPQKVATANQFSNVLRAEDAELIEKVKVEVRRATGEVYQRATLNTMHNGHCINMLASSVVNLRARFVGPIDYLEVGSFMGASMATMGTILKAFGVAGRLLSIDPYFEGGYREAAPGATGAGLKMSTPETMRRAMDYYQILGLEVEIIRSTSSAALLDLISRGEMFHYIFIDGKHEQLAPTSDLALSMRLLRPGGCVTLDDVNWPDVRPIYDLCRRHLALEREGFEKACFRADDPLGIL